MPLTSNWRVIDPSVFQASTMSPARPSVHRMRRAPRLAVAVDQPAAVTLAGGADAEDLVRADGAVDQRLADRLGRGDPHLLHVLLGQVRLAGW